MSTFALSNGDRIEKHKIDKNVRKAKKNKIEIQRTEDGYNSCEECGINGSDTFLDCAHIISVDKCQRKGRSELAWSLTNIKILCRECHRKLDNLYIGSK